MTLTATWDCSAPRELQLFLLPSAVFKCENSKELKSFLNLFEDVSHFFQLFLFYFFFNSIALEFKRPFVYCWRRSRSAGHGTPNTTDTTKRRMHIILLLHTLPFRTLTRNYDNENERNDVRRLSNRNWRRWRCAMRAERSDSQSKCARVSQQLLAPTAWPVRLLATHATCNNVVSIHSKATGKHKTHSQCEAKQRQCLQRHSLKFLRLS